MMRSMLLILALWVQSVLTLIPEKDLKPNVFVLTDISNEPDDAESLVRLLLYTNELNLKGIVATTSYWLNYTVHDEDIYPIIDAYEKVYPNLLNHSEHYPTAEYLRSIISTGKPVYGLKALEDKISRGAESLISAIDGTPVEDGLYILVWGGASVIAEALNHVKATRSENQVTEFIAKLTVYSISDQDNAGPWIRFNFPKLKYIASVHGFNQYGHAAWVGISGEIYNAFDDGGPDSSLVSKKWIEENVRSVGPLGEAYPEFMFIMEGDTPSTLFVLPNGLNDPTHPEYGGWGGRYTLSDLNGDFQHYGDSQDHVVGKDGRKHVSNKASIWRWREDFQNDFAARIQWTVKDFGEASHAPIIVANGTESVRPWYIDVVAGRNVTLDLSKSYDLNGRELTFKWMHYREVTLTQGNIIEVPAVEINPLNNDGSVVQIQAPSFKNACFNIFGRPLDSCKRYHFIAEVSNEGTPNVKSYRRFVFSIQTGDNVYDDEIKYLQNFEAVHDEL